MATLIDVSDLFPVRSSKKTKLIIPDILLIAVKLEWARQKWHLIKCFGQKSFLFSFFHWILGCVQKNYFFFRLGCKRRKTLKKIKKKDILIISNHL